MNHEAVLGYLPAGGWGSNWSGDPQYGSDWRQPGGWLFNLLSYLENQPLPRSQARAKAGQPRQCRRPRCRLRTLAMANLPTRAATILLANRRTDWTTANGGKSSQGFNGGAMSGPADYYTGSVNPGKAGSEAVAAAQNGVFYGATGSRMARFATA